MQACCTLTGFFPYHDAHKSLSNSRFAAFHKQYRMHPMQLPPLHIFSQQRCFAQGGCQSKAVWHIAWQATSAQLPLPSTATGQAKRCETLHPMSQNVLAATVTKPCLLAGGWLSKDSGRKAEEAQQLSFSFAAQVQDKAGPAPTQSPWHILASTGQLADKAAMLRQALAGLDRQGGLYLTPVLYRPTVQVCHAHHTHACCVVTR